MTLAFLAELLEEWHRMMPVKSFRWVFLGADLYGTRINHLPGDVVADYFSSFAERLSKLLPTAEFLLWSELDALAEGYRQNIRANFPSFVGDRLLERATRTAEAMEVGGDPRQYLIERIAEAVLIEEMLRPIKVSCVARHKDETVDGELPRLYLLPERLHAPWL